MHIKILNIIKIKTIHGKIYMAKSIKHPYQPSANMGCDTEFYLSKKKIPLSHTKALVPRNMLQFWYKLSIFISNCLNLAHSSGYHFFHLSVLLVIWGGISFSLRIPCTCTKLSYNRFDLPEEENVATTNNRFISIRELHHTVNLFLD